MPRTLRSLGLKSIISVSNTTLIVSTSSASLVREAISPRRAPEATEAGYSLAKLRRPSMAARRSSRRVALARRLLRVLMVSVAVCLAGACIRSIVGLWTRRVEGRESGVHEFMACRRSLKIVEMHRECSLTADGTVALDVTREGGQLRTTMTPGGLRVEVHVEPKDMRHGWDPGEAQMIGSG